MLKINGAEVVENLRDFLGKIEIALVTQQAKDCSENDFVLVRFEMTPIGNVRGQQLNLLNGHSYQLTYTLGPVLIPRISSARSRLLRYSEERDLNHFVDRMGDKTYWVDQFLERAGYFFGRTPVKDEPLISLKNIKFERDLGDASVRLRAVNLSPERRYETKGEPF